MTFGERLSEIRKDKGFSMTAMATRLSITAPGYKRLEDGTGAKTFEKLPLIAKALGCRIDDLFPEMDDVSGKTVSADGFESEGESRRAETEPKATDDDSLCRGAEYMS